MRIMVVVGARPNFMKAAPIIAAIDRHPARRSAAEVRGGALLLPFLVHTGQHYDDPMSGSFFRTLGLPEPDVHLTVGSGSHAAQTADIMRRFEPVLVREQPDVLVLVGDVNSTLACALVAAKATCGPSSSRPLIAHVEAGLRSFDRSMPEEVNRVLTDHLSDLLFVTEESGLANLRREGIPDERVYLVGNTMIDSLMAFKDKADASAVLDDLGLRADADGRTVQEYAVLTLHRPNNVDDRDALMGILAGLDELAADWPIVFPAHPRTMQRMTAWGMEPPPATAANGQHLRRAGRRGLLVSGPLGYLEFICLMKHARLVVTDSGGIQEETTALGVPCVTVRENTERPATVDSGTNIIAGTAPDTIAAAVRRQRALVPSHRMPPKWDGRAATRIVDILVEAVHGRTAHVGPPTMAVSTP